MTESREILEVPLSEMAATTFELQGQSAGECPNCGCRDVRHVGGPRPVCRHCGQSIFAFVAIPPKVKDQDETRPAKAAG